VPSGFDWRDIEIADHEKTDPLAQFTPENPPEAPPPPRTQWPLENAELRPERTVPPEAPPPRTQWSLENAEVRPERTVPPPPPPIARRSRRPSPFIALAALTASLTFATLYLSRGAAPRPTISAKPPAEPLPPPATAPAKDAPGATSVAAAPTFDSTPRAVPLQVVGGAFSPSFTPTGSTLFFHTGRSPEARLARADLDENDRPQRIVTVVANRANYHARVSPDGRQIAFDSDRYGVRAVYVAQIDGSSIRRVSGPGYAELPSWSPDGKFLTFVRGEPWRQTVWNLWVRNMRTSAMARLTSFRAGQTWTGSWFPDSRRVAFSHNDQLTITDITNGRSQVYRSPKASSSVRTPAVSPDGQHVIFQVTANGAWLLDLRTQKMKQVLQDPTAEEFAWEPGGRRVAYHSKRSGEWQIWIVSVPL